MKENLEKATRIEFCRTAQLFLIHILILEVVARLRAVVLSLAGEGVMLWDTSIMHGFEASAKYSLQELLSPDCMRDVAHLTQQRLLVEEVN